MEKHLVFVYGTLRKHEGNHFLLKGATLISEQSWTLGELYDTGKGYPMLKPSLQHKVFGELYEVREEQLKALDKLEDYQAGRKNNLYDRVVQTVYTDLGKYEAFLYISEKENDIQISEGDWKVYQLTQQKPETVYYFAYGSCMDMDRFQKAKVDHFFENVVGAGTIENYSMKYLFTASDGGRADIVEDGGHTEGILYECPFDTVDYLFKREGYYTGWYRATFVDVLVNGKSYQNVLTFHVYDKKEEIAPPEHYAVEILRGSKKRVSEKYYKKLVQQLRELNVPFELTNWE